jgi:hypothetical protein
VRNSWISLSKFVNFLHVSNHELQQLASQAWISTTFPWFSHPVTHKTYVNIIFTIKFSNCQWILMGASFSAIKNSYNFPLFSTLWHSLKLVFIWNQIQVKPLCTKLYLQKTDAEGTANSIHFMVMMFIRDSSWRHYLLNTHHLPNLSLL